MTGGSMRFPSSSLLSFTLPASGSVVPVGGVAPGVVGDGLCADAAPGAFAAMFAMFVVSLLSGADADVEPEAGQLECGESGGCGQCEHDHSHRRAVDDHRVGACVARHDRRTAGRAGAGVHVLN